MSHQLRLPRSAQERMRKLDERLEQAYHAPATVLGNKNDPLEEAIYIILSFQTNLNRFSAVWRRLRAVYPSWNEVDRAPTAKLASTLRAGGLHRQKARTIKRLLVAVRRQFGALSLDALRLLPPKDAESMLVRLPGLSWKGARCVLLYSLEISVFPIDVNAFRILKRTGVIPLSAVYRRKSLHDKIQEAVPLERRRDFHVNLVVHGQNTCHPRRPRCSSCAMQPECPKRGVQTLDEEQTR